MRIDLIITELDLGGAERCCASLAQDLDDRGHQVRLIALGPRPKPDRAQLVENLEKIDVELHFLNANSMWVLPSTIKRLKDLVRSDPPQVAQSFLWHANVISSLVYPKFKIPLVGGNRVSEPRWSRHWLGSMAARRMDKVVCVSQSVATWTQQVERVPASKIVVIPNGVAIDPIGPLHSDEVRRKQRLELFYQATKKQIDAPMLLFVGRLEPQKGIDIICDQMQRLLQACPNHHLVIIGDGSWRGRFETACQSMDDSHRVHVLGRRDDVRDWMRVADVLILPARYEGMPNVVLEAMAEGLAVATTNVDGVAELLGESTAAQSVQPEDWESWLRLVVSIANDRTLARKLGLVNFERCSESFRLTDQMAQYERLYVSLLNEDND